MYLNDFLQSPLCNIVFIIILLFLYICILESLYRIVCLGQIDLLGLFAGENLSGARLFWDRVTNALVMTI